MFLDCFMWYPLNFSHWRWPDKKLQMGHQSPQLLELEVTPVCWQRINGTSKPKASFLKNYFYTLSRVNGHRSRYFWKICEPCRFNTILPGNQKQEKMWLLVKWKRYMHACTHKSTSTALYNEFCNKRKKNQVAW